MSNKMYIGAADTAMRAKKAYVGVGGVARKVKKGYIGIGGVARQFFNATEVTFTGKQHVSGVNVNGKEYKMIELVSDGTLKIYGDDLQYWMCGGGAGGENLNKVSDVWRAGRGGGGGYVSTGILPAGEYTITIGAGGASNTDGGTTTIAGAETFTAEGGKYTGAGGSGGGGTARVKSSLQKISAGSGAGVSTCPFGLFTQVPYCAGGGGGGVYYRYVDTDGSNVYEKHIGGNGGSNGSSGEPAFSDDSYTYVGGIGGSFGGGKGGNYNDGAYNGADATHYGGGGGGAGVYFNKTEESIVYTFGGAGYQGVVYILVPA